MIDDDWTHHGKQLIAVPILLILLDVAATLHAPTMANAADTAPAAAQVNEQLLTGRWVRPDGGYVLELKEIREDGTLEAAYFNPRSINVAKAQVQRKEGQVTVFIELRDANYPGSTYNLRYDPKSDRLVGTYFQAVYGQTYNIEFLRAR